MEQFREYVKGCAEITRKWFTIVIICNLIWLSILMMFVSCFIFSPQVKCTHIPCVTNVPQASTEVLRKSQRCKCGCVEYVRRKWCEQ